MCSGETCGDISSKHNVPMHSSIEKNAPADSIMCENVLRGYRLCAVVTAPYGPSIGIPPHSNSRSATAADPTTTTYTVESTTTSTTYVTIYTTKVRSTPVTSLAPSATNAAMTTISPSAGSVVSVNVVPEEDHSLSSCGVMTYTAYATTTIFATATRYTSPNTAVSSESVATSSGSTAVPVSSTISASASNLSSTKCDLTAQAPAPTQPGVVSGCTKWYVAVSGDNCYQVAQKFGIPLNTFMDWNPGVEPPTCTRMLAGDAYCVATCGTSSSTSVASSASGSATTAVSVPPSIASGTTTTAWWTPSTTWSSTPSPTLGPHDQYKVYSGDGSVADGWPSIDQWVTFNYM